MFLTVKQMFCYASCLLKWFKIEQQRIEQLTALLDAAKHKNQPPVGQSETEGEAATGTTTEGDGAKPTDGEESAAPLNPENAKQPSEKSASLVKDDKGQRLESQSHQEKSGSSIKSSQGDKQVTSSKDGKTPDTGTPKSAKVSKDTKSKKTDTLKRSDKSQKSLIATQVKSKNAEKPSKGSSETPVKVKDVEKAAKPTSVEPTEAEGSKKKKDKKNKKEKDELADAAGRDVDDSFDTEEEVGS